MAPQLLQRIGLSLQSRQGIGMIRYTTSTCESAHTDALSQLPLGSLRAAKMKTGHILCINSNYMDEQISRCEQAVGYNVFRARKAE
jgi:hypothetical protein